MMIKWSSMWKQLTWYLAHNRNKCELLYLPPGENLGFKKLETKWKSFLKIFSGFSKTALNAVLNKIYSFICNIYWVLYSKGDYYIYVPKAPLASSEQENAV